MNLVNVKVIDNLHIYVVLKFRDFSPPDLGVMNFLKFPVRILARLLYSPEHFCFFRTC